MQDDLLAYIISVLDKDTILDISDSLSAGAQKATDITPKFGLTPKRSRIIEGNARFQIMEQEFHETCERHGGDLLPGGLIPGLNLKVFQPFMRFERDGKGLILGLAMMHKPFTLPNENMSRKAGVALNAYLTPSLDLGYAAPKIGDVFVLFLASKDPKTAGKISTMALGVVDHEYSRYLCYAELADIMALYITPPTAPVEEVAKPVLKVKTIVTPYKAPETPSEQDEA